MKKTAGTIDLTPTWSGVLDLLLVAYTEGTVEGQRHAITELRRMAKAADAYAAMRDSERKAAAARIHRERAVAMDEWERNSRCAAEDYEAARIVMDHFQIYRLSVRRKIRQHRQRGAKHANNARYWLGIVMGLDAELRELGA